MLLAELTFEQALFKDSVVAVLGALATALFVVYLAQLAVDRLRQRSEARASLRKRYTRLLSAQRKSRQASLALAHAGGATPQTGPTAQAAIAAHDEFIDEYHVLNLDVPPQMWSDVVVLREILDDTLWLACQGRAKECDELRDLARDARQNLEGRFRKELRSTTLQPRNEFKYVRRHTGSPSVACYERLNAQGADPSDAT